MPHLFQHPSFRPTVVALLVLLLAACFAPITVAAAAAGTSQTSEPDGTPSIALFAPSSPLMVGSVRFEARVEGSVTEVRFELDGEVVVQRRTKPYTASIHLGRLPRERVVSVVAVDDEGTPLARDEMVVNRQRNAFALRFSRPNEQSTVPTSGVLDVEIDLNTPPETVLDRIDLYLGETLVASLEDRPFSTEVTIADPQGTTYLRAVAYLSDGNTTETIRFVNGPDLIENVDVQYVQLYVSAKDRRSNQPILDLEQDELTVFEDGREQQIRRFERVSDLALNLAVLLDVSASMAPRLESSTQAAMTFFEGTMRPSDRAALISFNDRPELRVDLTADTEALAEGLRGIRAQRGTALYDSLVFALYQLSGVKGQRAVLVLSDGSDETSTLRYEDVLDYSRRAGVPIYAIRLELDQKASRARAELEELSSTTGGRAFFIHDPKALEGVYRSITEELRSRYLATYQSNQQTTNPRFREIEIEVSRKGTTVTTQRGYYP